MSIWLSVATAATLINDDLINDAGGLLSDALVVDQPVDLADGIVEIRGSIVPGDDEDMYKVQVSIPTLFSANTNVLGSFIEDTRLFIFDENGNGVCANHDNPTQIPGDPNASLAVIPEGTCVLSPGTYYIAISTFERYPVYQSGSLSASIFPGTPRDAVVTPNSGSGPIAGWTGTGQRGDLYIIQLKGVNYPPPECTLVAGGVSINGGTKTVTYLAEDAHLGIASVEVTSLNLNLDQDPSALTPGLIVPLDVNNPSILREGDNLAIDPPRPNLTFKVFIPNRFADLNSEIHITNATGVPTACPIPAEIRDHELTPPSCSGPVVIDDDPPTLKETTYDDQSGIARIEVDFLKNATLTIDGRPAGYADPAANIENPIIFNPPTTRVISIQATKIDPVLPATVVVYVYDNDNNMQKCDPHIIQYTIPPGHHVLHDTVSNLLPAEHHVTIHNEENGVSLAAVRANNGTLHTRWMEDQVERWIDTEADMIDGPVNMMQVMVLGHPGAKTLLVIADQEPTQPVVATPELPAATLSRSFSLPSNSFPSKLLGNHNWGDPR